MGDVGSALSDREMWRAVRERDSALNGRFVYGVHSTRIYCQPGCPSRRPKRERVTFFPSLAAAEAEGYRACRRCRPADRSSGDPTAAKVLAVCRAIDACEDRIPTLSELSKGVGLSPYHLQRTFKRVVGVAPSQYADARRVERLRARLREGQGIASSLYAAGYGSSSRLYERASGQLGMSPGTYRRGGRGEEIQYTVARSPLGRLLVAGTARGLCRVQMGRTALELTEDLRREFPDAPVRRDEGHLGPWVRALVDYLRGELPWPPLPLDIRATAFQRRVWEVLRSIPSGATCSYEEVARRVGRPRAARAVARACAQNPAALAIPCHRVVRKDGRPAGYRWGVEHRRALLDLEL